MKETCSFQGWCCYAKRLKIDASVHHQKLSLRPALLGRRARLVPLESSNAGLENCHSHFMQQAVVHLAKQSGTVVK